MLKYTWFHVWFGTVFRDSVTYIYIYIYIYISPTAFHDTSVNIFILLCCTKISLSRFIKTSQIVTLAVLHKFIKFRHSNGMATNNSVCFYIGYFLTLPGQECPIELLGSINKLFPIMYLGFYCRLLPLFLFLLSSFATDCRIPYCFNLQINFWLLSCKIVSWLMYWNVLYILIMFILCFLEWKPSLNKYLVLNISMGLLRKCRVDLSNNRAFLCNFC